LDDNTKQTATHNHSASTEDIAKQVGCTIPINLVNVYENMKALIANLKLEPCQIIAAWVVETEESVTLGRPIGNTIIATRKIHYPIGRTLLTFNIAFVLTDITASCARKKASSVETDIVKMAALVSKRSKRTEVIENIVIAPRPHPQSTGSVVMRASSVKVKPLRPAAMKMT
jgi:hypothetical protein